MEKEQNVQERSFEIIDMPHACKTCDRAECLPDCPYEDAYRKYLRERALCT